MTFSPPKRQRMASKQVIKKNTQARVYVNPKFSVGRNPIAKQTKRTFTYADSVLVTLNASGEGSFLFSTNSMFDPSTSGVGTQPLYFDQFMEMYNHYTVMQSSIIVMFADKSNRRLVTTLYVDDDTVVSNNAIAAWTRPGATSNFGKLDQSKNQVLTMGWSAGHHFSGNPLSKAELKGNASNSPAEQMFYAIVVKDIDLVNDQVAMVVKIEYTAVFDERKTVVTS